MLRVPRRPAWPPSWVQTLALASVFLFAILDTRCARVILGSGAAPYHEKEKWPLSVIDYDTPVPKCRYLSNSVTAIRIWNDTPVLKCRYLSDSVTAIRIWNDTPVPKCRYLSDSSNRR